MYDVYTTMSNSTAGGEALVKSRCYRSLRKSEEHHQLVVKLKKTNSGLVAKAHCSCKGGSGGHCNHVFALLYQLNDYNCLGYKDFPSDVTMRKFRDRWP